jgi:hypothetical protein
MEESLVFVEENQVWIYVVLALAGLLYVRLAIARYGDYQRTFFGLERERARTRLIPAGTMLGLVVFGFVVVFISTTFAGPALPISSRPTEVPTVSLLRTPDGSGILEDEIELATAISGEDSSVLSCSNSKATLRYPEDGDSISGRIEIQGVANIDGFAFYKLEIRSVALNDEWRAIAAGVNSICGPDCEDQYVLGTWDTSLVTPGEYEFRLVVLDTVGNAPMPCTIKLRVLPIE